MRLLLNEDEEIEIRESNSSMARRIKKWKYKMNQFCLKHKSQFTFKCLSCDEQVCEQCVKRNHSTHNIKEIRMRKKEKYMNYALDYRIKDIYCLSNVISYVNHNNTTILLFCTTSKLCELDLEKKVLVREISMPQLTNHLIYIYPNRLLTGSFLGILRMYKLDTMNQEYTFRQTTLIKQIIYFEKYKIVAVLNDSQDQIFLFNHKLKLIRTLQNPIEGCTFNHIEKLNEMHLVSCSDIYTPIIKWDISTGNIIQQFNRNLGIQLIKTLNFNRIITISLSYSMILRDSQFRKINTISNKYSMIDSLIFYNQQNIIFTNNLNSQITIFNIVKSKELQSITLPSEVRNLALVNNSIIASGKDLYIYSNKPVKIFKYSSL